MAGVQQPKQDQIIECAECGKEFSFSVRDQEFYEKQGKISGRVWGPPRRCKVCRDARKARGVKGKGAKHEPGATGGV